MCHVSWLEQSWLLKTLEGGLLNRKSYRKKQKKNSKEFVLHQSTVGQIVYKWRKFNVIVTLPRSSTSTKTNSVIVQEVTRNLRVTSKKTESLCCSGWYQCSRVHHHKNNRGVQVQGGSLYSPKKKKRLPTFPQGHEDKPEGYWKNFLWTGETKAEHFGLNEKRCVQRRLNTPSKPRTLSHLWNTVVAASGFGSALLLLDQDDLSSLIKLQRLCKHVYHLSLGC